MDWPALVESVFRCAPGHEWLIIASLFGVSSAIIVAALIKLWRLRFGPTANHRRAAKALRNQGQFNAQLNHRQQAMELFDLSIQLNPGQGHAYYLRGCLYAELGDANRAIADWKRCLAQLPRHRDAKQRLADLGGHAQSFVQRWAYVCGVAAVVLLVILVGISTHWGA